MSLLGSPEGTRFQVDMDDKTSLYIDNDTRVAPLKETLLEPSNLESLPLSEVEMSISSNSVVTATPDSTFVPLDNYAAMDTGEPPGEDQMLRAPDSSVVGHSNLFLYHDEFKERPAIASAINSITNYSSAIPLAPGDPDAKPVEKANLGTIMGVYLPCLQNIFGVILFIRLTWIVGTCGVIEGFLVVLVCCSVTMITCISMSAIATNGVVPAGGSYFMISRALGPEFGGAVGILFYIGTTFAGAMYIIGAVEIAMVYLIGPDMSLFGPDINDDFVKFNNYRVYGTLLLICMGTIVFLGVKFVNKFAAVALFCVIGSIVSIFVGVFVNIHGNDKAPLCLLGTRLLSKVANCTKDPVASPDVWNMYCDRLSNYTDIPMNETTPDMYKCEEYFEANVMNITQGIQGMSSDAFYRNLRNKYYDAGTAISSSPLETEYNLGGKPAKNQVTVDILASFTLIVGIFFPSVTGIMAGSNRSGDLADPQASIPVGTLCACLTTSITYLSSILFFGATVDPLLLRDKFGQSIGGSLVIGNVAWPHPKVIEIGSLLSTIGAGLQSLTGAPRLLQSIAKDGIIPFLEPVAVVSSRNEPVRALMLTICICQIAVLIGNVDAIAPLLSMFFLMCYMFVNLACALQTLLRTPNWRPRFKYYHWSLSLVGVGLCLAVMFMSSWYFALIAMFIAGVVYKYIEYRGAEKEWGDGIRGLALSAARFSLLRLEDGPPHTKNWRPQILIMCKMDEKLNVKHKRLFTLASQLKAGKGLTIGCTVVQGEFGKMYGESQAARQSLKQVIETEQVKGFPEVVVNESITDGICHMIQTSGLGGMKPNTVILGWPNTWRKKEDDGTQVFVNAIRNAANGKMALLVPKGIQRFPDTGDSVKGNIDIWWIVHDGGLLMLLPFLLKQHRTWRKCRLRIFTVAQVEDNSIQMKKDLKTFLYQLRIDADVEVVEMHDSDVSAYTYERTLIMEQRNEMLHDMRLKQKTRAKMPGRRLSLNENPLYQMKIKIDNLLDPSRHQDLGISMQKSPNKVKFSEELNGDVEDDMPPYPEVNNKAHNHVKPAMESIPPENANVRRMHTAVKLNEVIVAKSHEAKLVILNLPGPPKVMGKDKDCSYMEFLEVLTEGLERVLMVRGGGREVITIYS
ncbi:solute carrier family 12 member 4 isoform X2 [Eurytemora carolleeae]|uniref:solute carrier family 12 member 4 isoform X2 n=1 Tax=Eurytemora carolleeae TaxID=1294199 RepID=UPI000C7660C1|nr:solute carrier family 12 member 4 isoform X2 [Eurytemora carolleeae]|eukprot:XP_023327909.1 solute carrier family 12 member 4-like isoform X2 [Eurytemora affinis]